MDKASEAILAFKPVTFQYKSDHKPEGRRFSLILRIHLRVRETFTKTTLRSGVSRSGY